MVDGMMVDVYLIVDVYWRYSKLEKKMLLDGTLDAKQYNTNRLCWAVDIKLDGLNVSLASLRTNQEQTAVYELWGFHENQF